MLARRTVVATSVVRDALPGFPRDHQPDVVHYAVEADVLAMAPAVRGPVPLVVCAARLYPVKGVDVLLEATALVRLDVPDVRVRVVGGVETGYDDYALEIRALRARLGLDDVVDLGGFVNRPADEWRDAWLYVQPSRHETFGVAVAEAMACAVPVVVSRTGGLTEVVEHERTGLLVPPGDPAALAAAMVALLTDRDRAARLAAAARAHVHREFTTDRMVERMVAVYDAVLAA
jgi:glycosyltransferase involved in cell wall biosynthesis